MDTAVVTNLKKHIHLHWMEQGTPEWDAARDGKYTGSNADKLLKHANSKEVVSGIVREYATASTSTFKGNFHTKRGHLLEDEAIELHDAITGVTSLRPGIITNDKYPRCIFSPDGLVLNIKNYIEEVKCFEEDHHMELIRGDIPFKILAQIHYGLFITELPFAKLLPYNPKMERVQDKYKAIIIRRDPAINNNFKRILGGLA